MNFNLIAKRLDDAAQQSEPVEQISKTRNLTIEEAYATQQILVSKRLLRGNQLRGIKMGFTSKAKMEQMGVHDMIWGLLTSDMFIPQDGEVERDRFIHPRAEPEIAFRLACDVHDAVPLESIKNVVDALAPAIEIIDSRFKNFKFSLADVIADNCSSAAYCIGEWMTVDSLIQNIDIQLLINNQIEQAGNSSAILGNPWQSVVDATRLAAEYGHVLRKGDVILAGAATPASFIQAGQEIKMLASGFEPVTFKLV